MGNALLEFSNELANAVDRGGKSVVAVKEGGRVGVSATLWREGALVTAEHTIRGRDEVTLVLPSGDVTSASVAGRDPTTDISGVRRSNAAQARPHRAGIGTPDDGHERQLWDRRGSWRNLAHLARRTH